MQLHRRAILVGIGTAAVGSGAVFGSGAFTQVQATRDLTIGVDEDSTALLALEQNPDISAVFSHGNGELAIDSDRVGSGTGFNTGTVVQIGETHSELPEPESAQVVDALRESAGTGAAFKLTNNFDSVPAAEGDSGALDIVVSVDDLDGPSSELVLIGTAYHDGTTDTQVASTNNPQQAAFKAVPPDTPIYFAIQLRTVSTTDPADFDGTVSFRAGPSLTGAFPTSDEAQATTVDILTQPDSQQSVETPLTGPPSVIVTDPFGDSVSGVDVAATVNGADVTAVATTDADGNAEFSGAQGNLSDIMLAIDTSGSISGDPLDSAKTEAKKLIDAVDANFGLVSFGGNATLENDLSASDEAVKDNIDNLSGGGTTPMADAISNSQTELESTRASVSPNLIVVLADGAPDSDSQTREAASAAKSAGTTLLSIAFTDGADQDLMEDISSNPTDDGIIDEDDPNAFQAGEDDLSTVFDSIATAVPDNAIVISSTGEYTVDFSIDGTDESVLNDASVTSESFKLTSQWEHGRPPHDTLNGDIGEDKRMIVTDKQSSTKQTWITFSNDEAVEAFKAFKPEHKPDDSRVFQTTKQPLNRKFRRVSEEVGVKITVQKLRRWSATEMSRCGVDATYIDAFCGRTKSSVLEEYYLDYSPELLREIYHEAGITVLE